MNERIRELSHEAQRYALNNTTGPDLAGLNELWQEKFAELIVRECLNEIESQRSNGENADQWTITRDLCYHNMMSGLKQHFGVE